jgi:hypothetical protein
MSIETKATESDEMKISRALKPLEALRHAVDCRADEKNCKKLKAVKI